MNKEKEFILFSLAERKKNKIATETYVLVTDHNAFIIINH